jgi:hypothetical protein
MDTIVEDLKKAKANNAKIEEIHFIIQNKKDYHGQTGRYDVAMAAYSDDPEMWKEIYKLEIKSICDGSIDSHSEFKSDATKQMIACMFRTLDNRLNYNGNPICYKFDVFKFISDYIGKELFDDIMRCLPESYA